MWKFAPTNDAELITWYRRIERRWAVFDQGCVAESACATGVSADHPGRSFPAGHDLRPRGVPHGALDTAAEHPVKVTCTQQLPVKRTDDWREFPALHGEMIFRALAAARPCHNANVFKLLQPEAQHRS